jgi:hypothetical protein
MTVLSWPFCRSKKPAQCLSRSPFGLPINEAAVEACGARYWPAAIRVNGRNKRIEFRLVKGRRPLSLAPERPGISRSQSKRALSTSPSCS